MDPFFELNQIGNVYLIGGMIRDKLYNIYHDKKRKSKDYDIVITDIQIEKIEEILIKYGKFNHIGKHFGIIKFYYTRLNMDFDISLPRNEKSITTKNKDCEIRLESISLKEDVYMRDATINSIALKITSVCDLFRNEKEFLEKNIIDYVNGVDDIKNKIWRGIDPEKRFEEDPTRMMRAIRQCAQLDFEIEDETIKSIYKNKDLIKDILKVSPSRITNELVKILNTDKSKKWIDFIFDTSISDILNLQYFDLTRADEYDSPSCVKLPLLIKNPKDWIKKYDLNSCVDISVKYINFIIYALDIVEKITNNEIIIRKVISEIKSVDKTKLNHYDKFLFDMYYSINGYSDEIDRIYKSNKYTTPIDLNDIEIDGKYLMKKYGLKGKDIYFVKNDVFDKIIELELENKFDNICQYLDGKYLYI